MHKNTDGDDYKLEISGKGVKVDQTISKYAALRILRLIIGENAPELMGGEEKYMNSAAVPGILVDGEQTIDPKTFMASKKPMSDVEKITCLAFYLAQHRGITQFKTRELTDLNTEASQPKFSNPTVAARNAVLQQYLSLAGGGRKQITTRGEAVVRALPNREDVKKALEENRFGAKRRQKTKKKRLSK